MTLQTLRRKLYPGRFSAMSSKMSALLGYILDQHWTDPQIIGLSVTADGHLLGMREGDIGYNEYIGTAAEFRSNLSRLAVAADLTGEEIRELHHLYGKKVESWE